MKGRSHGKAGEGPRADRQAGRAREIGLFRYALIREAADSGLSSRERGRLVRALAEVEHTGPFGERVRVSRTSLDRWVRAWRTGGFDALVPEPANAEPRTPAGVLELAAALKRENPARTAAQVAAILNEHAPGSAPSPRTLQRHFARLELNIRPDGMPAAAFGRFEAEAPNQMWTGDALHGPIVAGRKTYLFGFLDDHSRLLTGYRWCHAEDTLRLEAALRGGLESRGLPQIVYLDNGAAMVSSQLLRALAVLGIRLVHSRPGKPQGRGKIERFFRTVREQFLVEVTPEVLASLDAPNPSEGLRRLNELFTAWVETVYHHRIHSETGQTPLARFHATPARAKKPTPQLLREAFLWSEARTVTKTATVSLHGNTYQVDAALVGRRVDLVFDPFDLTDISVRFGDRHLGAAVPHVIGRHVHPAARPETTGTSGVGDQARPTGIDYLNLVHDRHTTAVLNRRVNYADLGADQPQQVQQILEPDPALEAELASFAALNNTNPPSPADPPDPDQLDMLALLQDPTTVDSDSDDTHISTSQEIS